METWIGKLGKKGFITFMCGGVVHALYEPIVMETRSNTVAHEGDEAFFAELAYPFFHALDKNLAGH
jgi:hypothetical protein